MMLMKIIALLCGAVMSVGAFSGCSANLPDVEYVNYTMPEVGEEIAVVTFKDYGTVKIKLFPEQAPKGVENFVTHAKAGYYDETIIHRVVPDFVIQGGDPKGNGTGGSSIWDEDFDVEASENLRHFTGAVAYARPQYGGNSSQFYFVTSPDPESNCSDESFKYYSKQGMDFPNNVRAKYKEVGGAPSLDGGYTVFGQVFEGLDVVLEINKVETGFSSEQSEKPKKQVLIEKIEIIPYEG